MKNNCKYTFKVSLLIDDELSNHEKLHISNHIKSCPECKEFFETLVSIRNDIQDGIEILPIPEPYSLWNGILEKITRSKNESPFFSSLSRYLVSVRSFFKTVPGTITILAFFIFLIILPLKSLFFDKSTYSSILKGGFSGDNSCNVYFVKASSGDVSLIHGDKGIPTIIMLIEDYVQ